MLLTHVKIREEGNTPQERSGRERLDRGMWTFYKRNQSESQAKERQRGKESNGGSAVILHRNQAEVPREKGRCTHGTSDRLPTEGRFSSRALRAGAGEKNSTIVMAERISLGLSKAPCTWGLRSLSPVKGRGRRNFGKASCGGGYRRLPKRNTREGAGTLQRKKRGETARGKVMIVRERLMEDLRAHRKGRAARR